MKDVSFFSVGFGCVMIKIGIFFIRVLWGVFVLKVVWNLLFVRKFLILGVILLVR